MDSGCTYHICPHRDWFSTYEPLDSSVVLIGNNAQCSVTGMGTVQVKTHDGVLRTLSDVRHILTWNDTLFHLAPSTLMGASILLKVES